MPAAESRSRLVVTSRRARRQDEAGATLILALVFLVVVSATVLSLSSWAQGDLNSTRNFEGAQSWQSAANSSTQIAIQYVRYNFLSESLNASPPSLCWASNGPASLTFNSESVDSWCSTRWFTGTSSFRLVTISTCLSSTSAAACEVAPLLQAIVKVSDSDQSGNYTCSPVTVGSTLPLSTATTCGQGLTILDWAFQATPPQVTAVSASGGCSPTVTVTGSGFGNVTAVDAVSASSAGRTSNVVFPASSFSSSGTTQVTAKLPTLAAGQYEIRISTSAGSSALKTANAIVC